MAEESSSSADEPTPRPNTKPRDFALRRLSRRAHSEGELRQKMRRVGYSDPEIEDTLTFLRERRYVDDSQFARDYARARAEHRRWGPARIEARLRSLQVSDRNIEAALAEAFPHGERETAANALQKLLASDRRRRSPSARKARAYRHLLSRGFSPDLVHELVSGHDFGDTEELEF